MTERKISDVILDMEKTVNQIHSYIANVDLLLKMLVSRFPSETIQEEPVVFTQEQTTSKSAATSAGRITEQTVHYASNDKPVVLAKIKIYRGSELVHESDTTPQGKWTAKLAHGLYKVSVQKHATATKPELNLSYNIDVKNAPGPCLLPAIKG
jgi:hypothetical protein